MDDYSIDVGYLVTVQSSCLADDLLDLVRGQVAHVHLLLVVVHARAVVGLHLLVRVLQDVATQVEFESSD